MGAGVVTDITESDEAILSCIRDRFMTPVAIGLVVGRTETWVSHRLTSLKKRKLVHYSTMSRNWYASKAGGWRL
jgi:hypothetical protein